MQTSQKVSFYKQINNSTTINNNLIQRNKNVSISRSDQINQIIQILRREQRLLILQNRLIQNGSSLFRINVQKNMFKFGCVFFNLNQISSQFLKIALDPLKIYFLNQCETIYLNSLQKFRIYYELLKKMLRNNQKQISICISDVGYVFLNQMPHINFPYLKTLNLTVMLDNIEIFSLINLGQLQFLMITKCRTYRIKNWRKSYFPKLKTFQVYPHQCISDQSIKIVIKGFESLQKTNSKNNEFTSVSRCLFQYVYPIQTIYFNLFNNFDHVIKINRKYVKKIEIAPFRDSNVIYLKKIVKMLQTKFKSLD